MSLVPLVVSEEHHEAFLVWHWAVAAGIMPAEGGTLLHVDEHVDLAVPRLSEPLAAVGDVAAARRTVYTELDVGSFLVPVLYQGLFERVCWLRPHHDRGEKLRVRRLVITARQDDPRRLIVDDEHLFNRQRTGMPRRSVLLELRSPDDDLGCCDPLVLGIDLDVLCSNPYPHHPDHRLEVAASSFDAFEADPYHFLRISPGARVVSRRVGDRYYLVFNPDPPREWRGTAAERAAIEAAAARIGAGLARLPTTPRLVTVSRSRRSGYLPDAHAEYAERTMLGMLAGLYELELRDIADLS